MATRRRFEGNGVPGAARCVRGVDEQFAVAAPCNGEEASGRKTQSSPVASPQEHPVFVARAGLGREGLRYAIEEMTDQRLVVFNM